MKRAGKRGENKWERVSPGSGPDRDCREAQPRSRGERPLRQLLLQPVRSAPTTGHAAASPSYFGTPNGFHNALLCWIPTFMIETAISGWSPFETDPGTSCVRAVEHEPGRLPCPAPMASTSRSQRHEVIVVDPAASRIPDLWLPLCPGSDAALSLAMLNVILNEFLYDFDFVRTGAPISTSCATPHMGALHSRVGSTHLGPILSRSPPARTPPTAPATCGGQTRGPAGRSASAGTQARAIMPRHLR